MYIPFLTPFTLFSSTHQLQERKTAARASEEEAKAREAKRNFKTWCRLHSKGLYAHPRPSDASATANGENSTSATATRGPQIAVRPLPQLKKVLHSEEWNPYMNRRRGSSGGDGLKGKVASGSAAAGSEEQASVNLSLVNLSLGSTSGVNTHSNGRAKVRREADAAIDDAFETSASESLLSL